jgi:Ca-activated chloride channel family protein
MAFQAGYPPQREGLERRSRAMSEEKKHLWQLLGLIVVLSGLLAGAAADGGLLAEWSGRRAGNRGGAGEVGQLRIETGLVQEKVLVGSDGEVAVNVTLSIPERREAGRGATQAADLVVVLDRSGSMAGPKLDDARQAVRRLVEGLADGDRLALVSYANGATMNLPLSGMEEHARHRALQAVTAIQAGGGTDLGAGLRSGIAALGGAPAEGRARRVLLISDGLANQGTTDPAALGRMAAEAAERRITVSAVGVGVDYNEALMTALADHGAGRYYFLEHPEAFARVFQLEADTVRQVAASGVELRIPLGEGQQLVAAGGLPIRTAEGSAWVRIGDLTAGERRQVFLTYRVPTHRAGRIALPAVEVRYWQAGTARSGASHGALSLACVTDEAAVLSSIDRSAWGRQVVREAFGRLQEDVAESLRKGDKEAASARIDAYETRHRALNAAVGSAAVAGNLDDQVPELRRSLDAAFVGPPPAAAERSKQAAKALQYEGYQARRDRN